MRALDYLELDQVVGGQSNTTTANQNGPGTTTTTTGSSRTVTVGADATIGSDGSITGAHLCVGRLGRRAVDRRRRRRTERADGRRLGHRQHACCRD